MKERDVPRRECAWWWRLCSGRWWRTLPAMAPCPCPPGEPPRIWRMGRTWEVVRKWHLMGLDSPPSGGQPPAGSRVASAETSGMSMLFAHADVGRRHILGASMYILRIIWSLSGFTLTQYFYQAELKSFPNPVMRAGGWTRPVRLDRQVGGGVRAGGDGGCGGGGEGVFGNACRGGLGPAARHPLRECAARCPQRRLPCCPVQVTPPLPVLSNAPTCLPTRHGS